jgi:AcrR family transcriptional regulator
VKNQESYTIWLETAYRLFAEKGPEQLTVKELAKQCQLPRTNFYYYFENKEELIDKIIELHFTTTTQVFNVELEKRLKTYIPDFYMLIHDTELGIRFARQLFKNREIPKYNDAHKKGVALSADLIIPHWKEFFHIDLPHDTLRELWFTLADTWYARLNFNNFTSEYLCELCYEIMDSIKPLIHKKTSLQSY